MMTVSLIEADRSETAAGMAVQAHCSMKLDELVPLQDYCMFGFSRLILKTLHKIAPERDFYWSAHSETIYHWTRARAARPAVYGFTMHRSIEIPLRGDFM